jgi:hypothetical protein
MKKPIPILENVLDQIRAVVNPLHRYVEACELNDGTDAGKNVAEVVIRYAETFRKERDELRTWKESAMATTPPLQEIGRELGLTLGESIHDKILPALRDFKERQAETLRDLAALKADIPALHAKAYLEGSKSALPDFDEVARVRLPVAVGALSSLIDAMTRQFGKGLEMMQRGEWLVFVRPKSETILSEPKPEQP